MISRLKGWTDQYLESLQTVPGMVSIGENSLEALQNRISGYLQQQESYGSSTPSPWPFVKLVKTFFDSPILEQDIVLVDLPGTSDVNQTRVRASLQFLNNVDYVGVVSKVERVETDANTHRYLIDAFRRKRGANVLLVATGSEVCQG
ncbi:hypothetical protein BK809_0000363 [Diplodia seriata]|uniref:Uncharacterized protein n=1 Tax=Diplodia seriata TaxID=420778 RepID=A0A1S8BAC8_9PEZI|nr:hypothetical protein BK809_0000363 [Diplodia seriata]